MKPFDHAPLLAITVSAATVVTGLCLAATPPSPEQLESMKHDCYEWAKYDDIQGKEEVEKYVDACVQELITEYAAEEENEARGKELIDTD